MAPGHDQLELIKPTGEVEFHALNARGITYIGADPKNDIIIHGPTIKPFHAFLDHRQKPARLTLLAQESDSLPVKPLKFLANLDTVELEGYILIFLQGDEDTLTPVSATPEPLPPLDTPKPASLLTIPFPDQTDEAMAVQLPARAWTMAVEETLTFEVSLTNSGQSTAIFIVEIVGLDEGWVTISKPQLNLNPSEHQTTSITITPPRLPGSRAGIHHFAVKVTSPAYPQRYAQQRATLTIHPYFDFSLGGLSPKQQTVSWSKPSAHYIISITNTGNSFTPFQLTGRDDDAACSFEFQIPGETAGLARQVEFTLLPNEAASIPIRVTPISKLLVSPGRRTHRFTITMMLLQGGQSPRLVLGQLVRKPLVGPGMLALLTLAIGLLGIAILGPLVKQSMSRSALKEGTASQTDSSAARPVKPALPLLSPQPAAEDKKSVTYEEIFKEIASQYNLDWRLLEAVAFHESRMNNLAVGRASDMGLMQVIPSTWNEWAPKLNVYDPFDPYSNILVGAAYLAHVRDFCLSRGRSEPHWMLIGYNWGPYRLGQFFDSGGTWDQIPLEQREYALDVLETATFRALSSASFEEFYRTQPVEE
jgi:hypothetical protein